MTHLANNLRVIYEEEIYEETSIIDSENIIIINGKIHVRRNCRRKKKNVKHKIIISNIKQQNYINCFSAYPEDCCCFKPIFWIIRCFGGYY